MHSYNGKVVIPCGICSVDGKKEHSTFITWKWYFKRLLLNNLEKILNPNATML